MLRFRAWLLLAVLLCSPPLFADATPGTAVIGAEVWSRPRSAAQLAALPPLRALMELYERQPDGRVLVFHGRSEEAVLWAEELRSWFTALGLPSARVRLVPDATLDGELRVELRAHGEES